MNKKFIPVMLTSFDGAGAIDYEGLDELIEMYLAAGAGGLFANCLSSEMYHLEPDEMLIYIGFVVEKVKQRVPVVATGSFGKTIEDKADFVKKVYKKGVDAVIVISSLLVEEVDTDEVFLENVEKLFELTEDIPLGFYECPVPYKRVVRPEFLEKWVKTGRVVYHKDTCLDINMVRDKNQRTLPYSEFGLYDAYMVHAVDSLKSGSAGLSCIQGNYFPELVVWLCNHYNEETKEVKQLQEFFQKNMDLMHDYYPASAKWVLQKRGLHLSTFCRNGSVLPEEKVLDQLEDIIEEAERLQDVLMK